MKIEIGTFVLLVSIGIIHNADANSFCYGAVFSTNAALSGTVASRSNGIESAVGRIIEEIRNETSLGFTVEDYNTTLEKLLGNTSYSEYVVRICLNNSSKTAAEFTDILRTFNFATQIDASSVSANDFNECSNSTICTLPAVCDNTDGDYNCVCPETYADKSKSGSSEPVCELPTNFTCSQNSISLTAYFPYFSALGINESDLSLGSCSGILLGDSLDFSGGCSPVLKANSTHITFTWNLTNINPNAALTIGSYVNIPVTCVVQASGNVTLEFNGSRTENVGDVQNTVNGQTVGGDIQVSGFTGENFANGLSPGDRIKTNAKLGFTMGPSKGFIRSNVKTVCQRLSAAPAEGSRKPVQLIENGCKASNPSISSILDTLELIQQGTLAVASLRMSAFFFSGSVATSLIFGVGICIETGGSSCQPTCNSRRRRSFVNLRSKRQSTLDSDDAFFTFVKDSGDNCTKNCGDGICVIDARKYQECVCFGDALKQADGRCLFRSLLEDSETLSIADEEDYKTAIIVVVSVVFILLLALITFLAMYCIKRGGMSKTM